MSTYELLLSLHVVAVIIWLGAGFLIAMLVFGAARAHDPAREAGYHRDVGWLTPRVFIPASLGSLLTGILLVIDGDWNLDTLWIVIGLAGWAVSFGLGFFFFRTEAQRVTALVEQHGPANEEASFRVHRMNVIERWQLLVLLLVVADMVIKPTGDDGGVLVVGAAILVAAALLAVRSIQTGPAPVSEVR